MRRWRGAPRVAPRYSHSVSSNSSAMVTSRFVTGQSWRETLRIGARRLVHKPNEVDELGTVIHSRLAAAGWRWIIDEIQATPR